MTGPVCRPSRSVFVNVFAYGSVSLGVTGSRSSPIRPARISCIAVLTVAFFGLSGALPAAERDSAPVGAPHQQQTAAPTTQVVPNRPPSSASGPGWDWWADQTTKKDLKLTEEQVRKIREIFEKREAEVKPVMDSLTREGERLERMTRERVADESTYAVQVGKVQHLWMRVRESRTMMIYRMFLELQPEQHKKLQEIMERRRSMDGRGSGPR